MWVSRSWGSCGLTRTKYTCSESLKSYKKVYSIYTCVFKIMQSISLGIYPPKRGKPTHNMFNHACLTFIAMVNTGTISILLQPFWALQTQEAPDKGVGTMQNWKEIWQQVQLQHSIVHIYSTRAILLVLVTCEYTVWLRRVIIASKYAKEYQLRYQEE